MGAPTNETILIVDDEPMMVNLCESILRMGGYNILRASDGEEALLALQNAASEVQMALLDVIMPRITGIELAQRMRTLRPGIKLVLMSGYGPEEVARIAGDSSTFPVIWKPFRAESLLRMVENVLSKPGSQAAEVDKRAAAGSVQAG
jgi:two-component system cell cycle sensor histidine kinase/response regulator CckA